MKVLLTWLMPQGTGIPRDLVDVWPRRLSQGSEEKVSR